MSQSDNFLGGFLLGTVVGGVVGGILGVVVTSRLANKEEDDTPLKSLDDKGRKRRLSPPTEESIELARRGLEDKIAQLNDAIDDVRQQLSNVDGNGQADPSNSTLTSDSN
jgi:gas vesicle protein